MMVKVSASALSLIFLQSNAFQPAAVGRSQVKAPSTSTAVNIMNADLAEDIVEKLRRLIDEETTPKFDKGFDDMMQSIFPGAINNKDLETTVVKLLAEKGFDSSNTLLATSLCCDELARRLEDDFVKIYGNNFNLGGLSGTIGSFTPFADDLAHYSTDRVSFCWQHWIWGHGGPYSR